MTSAIVELFVYAAAMDLYRRNNINPGSVQAPVSAILSVVDWNTRPALAR